MNANSGKTPFEIIMGYNPTATLTFPMALKFPALEERLRGLHDIRKEALVAHDMVRLCMVERITQVFVLFK